MTDKQATLPGMPAPEYKPPTTPAEKAQVILDMQDSILLTKCQTDPAWSAKLLRELAFAVAPDPEGF